MPKFTPLEIRDVLNLTGVTDLSPAGKRTIIEDTIGKLIKSGYSQRQAIAFYQEAFLERGMQSARDAVVTIYNLTQRKLKDPARQTFVSGLAPDEKPHKGDIPDLENRTKSRGKYLYVADVSAQTISSTKIDKRGYSIYSNKLLSPSEAERAILADFNKSKDVSKSPKRVIAVNLTHIFKERGV